MYVIAVDDDGTREEQNALSSIASFQFVNQDGETFDYNSKFTEFVETSFQHYHYAFPKLEEDAEGHYNLILGCYIDSFYTHIHTHTHTHTHTYTHIHTHTHTHVHTNTHS